MLKGNRFLEEKLQRVNPFKNQEFSEYPSVYLECTVSFPFLFESKRGTFETTTMLKWYRSSTAPVSSQKIYFMAA